MDYSLYWSTVGQRLPISKMFGNRRPNFAKDLPATVQWTSESNNLFTDFRCFHIRFFIIACINFSSKFVLENVYVFGTLCHGSSLDSIYVAHLMVWGNAFIGWRLKCFEFLDRRAELDTTSKWSNVPFILRMFPNTTSNGTFVLFIFGTMFQQSVKCLRA